MRLLSISGVAVALVLLGDVVTADGLPQTRLGRLQPPGGQAGTTFEVRVAGEENLDYASLPGLVFSHPGIAAQAVADQQTGSWREKAFRVTVAPDVPPGRYEAMLDGQYGASNPRPFQVEAGRVILEGPESGREAAAPLGSDEVVYGTIAQTADVDSFTVRCEAARTIVVRCDADRIGSPLQPLLELTGPTGKSIGTAGGPYTGRAILAVTPPGNGECVLRVTDAAYRGGPDFAYRLIVTTQPVVTSVWPPALVPGQTSPAEVYGYNLPGGETVQPSSPFVRKAVEITAPADSRSLPTSAALLPSQAAVPGFDFAYRDGELVADPVPVFFAPRPLATETEPNDEGQDVSVPAEIAGRFDRRFDADRFVFDANEGDSFFIEAFAERYGSPGDPVLTVEKFPGATDQGAQTLVTQDDQAEALAVGIFDMTTRDPAVRFEAPDDGRYRVTLRDRYGTSRGGPELVYRLSVRRPSPDFVLAVVPFSRAKADDPPSPASPVLRKGENISLNVFVVRRDGFDGPITLRAEGLPAGVTASPATVAPGMNSVPLVFSAAVDAAPWRGSVRVVGESSVGGESVRRVAVAGAIGGDGKSRAVTTEIGRALVLSVIDEHAPFRLDGNGGAVTAAAGSQIVVPLRQTGHRSEATLPVTAAAALPGDAKVAVEIKANDADKAEQFARLMIDPKAPARSHAVAFSATSQVDYSAFPHRLRRSKAEQESATNRFAQAEEALRLAIAARDESAKTAAAAEQSKSAAELSAMTAATALEQRKAEFAAAEQALAAAQAAESAAEETVKDDVAKAVAEQTLELERLRGKLEKAQRASEDAAKQAAQAGSLLESAKATFREREQALKSAEEVRKRDEAAKKAADQAAAEAEKAAAAQKIGYVSAAPPLTLTVAPALAEFASAVPDGGSIKRGGSLDVKITAKRVGGFAGAISLGLALLPGISGLTAEPVSIAADQSEAQFRIIAEEDAPEGDVLFPAIRATFDAPGSAPLDLPVSLKVVP